MMSGNHNRALEGKVAIVTGASRNIGRATALTLAAQGAAVVVGAGRDAEAARGVAEEISAAGGRGIAHLADVTDEAADLLWFYVRTYGLAVTDLMQGPVYGLSTEEADKDPRLLPNFHYDDIFGTVVNRFLVQAVAGVALTVYGKGGQTRGYLNLRDTLQCIELAATHPAKPGELRIFNQFTEQLSVNEIAENVQQVGNRMGLGVEIKSIENPRKEAEEHYYNPSHSGLLELGLKPHLMTDDVVAAMLERVLEYKDRIDNRRIMPRVRWS